MPTPTSSTVLKAFDVLNLFGEQSVLGAGEVARRLDIPKASAHRMLVTLAAAGVIESGKSGQYRLGWRLFELGSVASIRQGLSHSAAIPMQRLSLALRAPAHLGVRETHDVLYVEKAEHQETALPTRVGGRYPLHATGLGKVLLAFGPEDLIHEYFASPLEALTPFTVTAQSRFLHQLARIRQMGVAVDDQESVEGFVCAAAPVRNRLGEVVAAVSVSAPRRQYINRLRELAAPVRRTAALIERRMGYSMHRDDVARLESSSASAG